MSSSQIRRNPSLSLHPPPPDIIRGSRASINVTQTKNDRTIDRLRPLSTFLFLICLVVGSWFKFSIISLIYFIVFLMYISAFKSNHVWTRKILVGFVIALSVVVCILHILVQVAYSTKTPLPDDILELFGFRRIADVPTGLRTFLPDVVILVSSLVQFFISRSRSLSQNTYQLAASQNEGDRSSQRPRRRTRKELRRAYSLLSLTYTLETICLIISAISVTNLLSLFYSFIVIWRIFKFSFEPSPTASSTPSSASYGNRVFAVFGNWLWQLQQVYGILHLLLIYCYQFPLVRDKFLVDSIVKKLGLFSYFDLNITSPWEAYLYAAGIIGFISMIILIDAIEYHYKLPSPRLDYVFQFFLRQRNRNRSIQQTTQTFQSQQQQNNSARVIVDFFVQNVVFIASFAILGFAVTIPSFLSLPLLCWSCVVLLTDSKATFNKTFILALLLSLGILAEAVVFNLHGFYFSEREDLSLTRQNAVYFYVQTSLLLISSVVYNIYISSRRFRNGRQRTASTGSDFQDLAVTTGPPSLFSQLKSSSIMFWNAFKHVVWKYSYLFSLGIVLVCGLQKVNLVNGILMLIFLIYILFPSIATQRWRLLLIYTSLVIILQFIFQFEVMSPYQPPPFWGFERYDILPIGIIYHLVILFFGVIQNNALKQNRWIIINSQTALAPLVEIATGLGVANAVEAGGESSTMAGMRVGNQPFLPVESSNVFVRVYKKGFLIVRSIVYGYSLVIPHLALLLNVILFPPEFLVLPYIIHLFFSVLVITISPTYFIQSQKTVLPISTVYALIATIACYIYQFPGVHVTLEDWLGRKVTESIGLVVVSGSKIFVYLLRHASVVVTMVVQMRLWKRTLRHKPLSGDNGLLRTHLPQWFNKILESIQRVFIIHISKVILLCLFITCVKRITLMNLIGFGFLLLGGIWMPGSWYAIVTLWVEIDILAQILFQIPVIQDLLAPLNHLSYYGLTTFPEPALPSSNLSIEIILLFVISLRALSKSWLNQLISLNPTLPSNQSDWLYFPTTDETILPPENAPGADVGRNDEERANNMNDEYNWEAVLREFGNLVNFTLSNIANQVGFEIVLIIHVVVALYRLNVYGVLYIIMNGIWLMEGSRGSSLVWKFYILLLIILLGAQYCLTLALPTWETSTPWFTFSDSLKFILGLPNSRTDVLFIPDGVLWLSCIFLQRVLPSQANRTGGKVSFYRFVSRDGNLDFIVRSIFAKLKLMLIRYWFWIVLVLSFGVGTAAVSVLSSIFLVFSLYFINRGEAVLLDTTLRNSRWKYLQRYTYFWFLLLIVYQIPAYLLNLSDSQEVLRTIGLRKFSLTTESDEFEYAFSPQIRTILALFATLLIQRRILESADLPYVLYQIHKEYDNAFERAQEVKQRRNEELDLEKEEYEEKIKLIQKGMLEMKRDYKDIEDWIILYKGAKPEKGKQKENETQITGDAEAEVDDKSVTAENENTISVGGATKASSSDSDHQEQTVSKGSTELVVPYTTTGLRASQIELQLDGDEDELAKLETDGQLTWRLLLLSLLDRTIISLYRSAQMYSVKCPLTSNSIFSTDIKLYHRFLYLIRGIFYAGSSKAVFVYLAIYIHQIYQADILSTIPAIVTLLIAIVQFPRPRCGLWQTFISYFEFCIVLKYVLHFQWSFNESDCSKATSPNDELSWIGIRKTCSSFFFEVSTDLLVLLTCITQRELLKKNGLWTDLYQNESILQEVDENPGQSSVKSVSASILPNEDDNDDVIGSDEDDVEKQNSYWSSLKMVVWESMVDKSDSPGRDYYVAMFIFDFLVFILTVAFWSSFSGNPRDANLVQTIFQDQSSSIPPLFLAIAIINFCIIIIDRMIYIARSWIAKYFIQFATVFGFHIWIFFVLPVSNQRPFNQSHDLQFWYFMKCLYWYFSGMQLRSGYPRVRLTQFLLKYHNTLNRWMFTIYRSIPFVFEIRSLIDWTLTPTSLSFWGWLKFEDIYANVFSIKCDRVQDQNNTRKFGDRQEESSKYTFGFSVIALLVALLWFPPVILSLPGATTIDFPASVQVSLRLNSYEPVFVQEVLRNDIRRFNASEFDVLKAETGLGQLLPSWAVAENVLEVSFPTTPKTTWNINPVAFQDFLKTLNTTNATVEAKMEWVIRRSYSATLFISGSSNVSLKETDKSTLFNMLNGGKQQLVVSSIYPRYLHALVNGPIINLDGDNQQRSNISIFYNASTTSSWFEINRIKETDIRPPETQAGGITFIILSDSIPSLSYLNGYGIIGLYVVVVFSAGSFLRNMVSNLASKIPYEELPNVDYILTVCSDAYLARAFGDFYLEETLYWHLITLFRNPKALIEVTKMNRKID